MISIIVERMVEITTSEALMLGIMEDCKKHEKLFLTLRIISIVAKQYNFLDKVCSSYGPLAYLSDIFISGKNVVISAEI